jgi:hypothetical protein
MTITQLKNILGRKFRGANIDDVQGISDYTLFEEAGSNLLSAIDPYETVRHGEIDLFNQVYDYGLSVTAPDLKGKKIIDIRPQASRNHTEDFRQTFTEDFDRDKNIENNWFSVEFDEATKFLRVNKSLSNSMNVTDLVTTNYAATSLVSNIAEDTILYHDDGKSLRFDVGSGANLLTWAGTAVDLSAHESKSSLFLWVYYPDSSIVTSLVIRIGSSATAYFTITGVAHFGTIRNGWNLYRFDWNGAAETSTADTTAIDYVRFGLTTTAADTDIRIQKLSSKLPAPHEVVYYSNAIFRPVSGSTWLTLPTDDTDIVNLEIEAQNILMNECAVLISEGLQNEAEAQKYYTRLHGDNQKQGLYAQYRKDKPSETIRPNSRWYTR